MSNCGKVFLLACISLLLNINVFAQRINLRTNNITVKDAIEQLKKSTGYSFYFSPNDLDTQKIISISLNDATIDEAIRQLLTDQKGLSYEIKNKRIQIIKAAPQTINVAPQKSGVYGKIIDDAGEPLIGVAVREIGTQNITITDSDGGFYLDVQQGKNLEISCVGFKTMIVAAKEGAPTNISMSIDTQALDEVVVVGYGSMQKRDLTGYGSMQKRDLTGAISQVKGDDISDMPLRSASDAIQGKIAGVTVTANSGSPGALGDVRIRGVGTLNGNDPLYVVDGLPQSGIGWLNARDIQNIEVLKDASAQAIYGSRAANGVILITTKRGGKGENYSSNIEFDANIGFQSCSKEYDMLDAEGFMEYKNRAYAAAGKELLADFATKEKRDAILNFLEKNGGRAGTNWWKAITNSPSEAINQNYNLAFSGGITKLRYRSSFGYMDQKGLVKGSEYKRLNGRINVDSEVKEWLTLSGDVNVSYEERKNIQENDSYQATVFTAASADPITPVYRDNLVDVPDFMYDRIYNSYEPSNPWSKYTGVLYSNKNNPVAQVDRASLNKWHGIATKIGLSGENF